MNRLEQHWKLVLAFLTVGAISRQALGQGNRACEILIGVDEILFNHHQQNMTHIMSTIVSMMDHLNGIYQKQIFVGPLDGVYFRLKEVRILFNFCSHCNQTARLYLDEFSEMDFSDFCLAHVLTYRDFPGGLQGMAHTRAICSKTKNTGFTTLINHEIPSDFGDFLITFAHEIGHNFGANHDEDVGCNSDFIMASQATTKTARRFSACSVKQILSYMTTRLGQRGYNCLTSTPATDPSAVSFCGNGVLEGDEECDCGLDYRTCSDPCCYAARIDPTDLVANSSALPCRTHSKQLCLHQWRAITYAGLFAPLVFIGVVSLFLSLGLWLDWRHKRICYGHMKEITHLSDRKPQPEVPLIPPSLGIRPTIGRPQLVQTNGNGKPRHQLQNLSTIPGPKPILRPVTPKPVRVLPILKPPSGNEIRGKIPPVHQSTLQTRMKISTILKPPSTSMGSSPRLHQNNKIQDMRHIFES